MGISSVEHDFIGIGFGPSNLAIALAMEEPAPSRKKALDCCFIEKKPEFVWHGSMLLEGSDMQVSFLKDLATLRDPTSHFTFINYLHKKGRLKEFINLKSFFPSRIEYNDYLQWVAGHFDHLCRYGEEVVGVEPVRDGEQITRLRVHSRGVDGRSYTRTASNMVFGIGGVPAIPAVFEAMQDARVFHAAHYLERLDTLVHSQGTPKRIAVLGGAQSAAEVYLDLVARFGDAQVTLITRGDALMPADDSPFVNEIFHPQFTDVIYHQPQDVRRATLERFRSTNYSVVDLDLIQHIYKLLYEQRVRGVQRCQLWSGKEVTQARATGTGIQLDVRHQASGATEHAEFDAVVLATGYRRDDHKRLLGGLAEYIAEGFSVGRDYRLHTVKNFLPKIYLQGCCEDSHGLSDTLLSVLAVRSMEILESMLADRPERSRMSQSAMAALPVAV
nr:lysine N(6)-hydroxylase/L-ornithine N(5)-oxygenase family protein [uncultured Rhodoferax sp.]